jgi:predicted nucleic acid-binding protein
LSGLRIRNKRVCFEALDIFAQSGALDYADALAVAHMRNQGIVDIYSFDKHFDQIAGITRTKG